MLKIIAALLMLIDHIGLVLFPASFAFRIIGRLSMPIYAYCIAKGFYYSRQHGTLHKYLRNMLIFATVSQIPYWYMTHNGFNIGYTWLISLLLLMIANIKSKSLLSTLGITFLCFLPVAFIVGTGVFAVDYGLYGIITPLLFYVLIVTEKENLINYMIVLVIGYIFYLFVQNGSILQIISIFSAFILSVRKKLKIKIKIPKWVFYAFYPVHIAILLVIKQLN